MIAMSTIAPHWVFWWCKIVEAYQAEPGATLCGVVRLGRPGETSPACTEWHLVATCRVSNEILVLGKRSIVSTLDSGENGAWTLSISVQKPGLDFAKVTLIDKGLHDKTKSRIN